MQFGAANSTFKNASIGRPTPAPTVTPSTDLVGAWNFNETTGSALDKSSFGNTGAISGASRTTAGKYGGALSFDGVNDSVTVADKASLDLTKGMTIEAGSTRPS